MATVIFDVKPEDLLATATVLEEKAKEFTNTYKSIYTAVSDLRVSFKGVASDTFNQRIEGYRNDFANADKALQKYIQFMRNYANKLIDTENEIKSSASTLSIGK